MDLLIVLHFDLLPYFLGSLTDMLVEERECRERARGNWHPSRAPGLTRLPPPPAPPPDTTQGRKPMALNLLFS